MTWTINANTNPIVNALNGMVRQTQSLQVVTDNIGDAMVSNIKLGIKAGESPWGMPYAPLKNLRRSNLDSRKGDKPLNDTRPFRLRQGAKPATHVC